MSVLPTALAFARHGHAVLPLNWPVDRGGKLLCSCGGDSRGRPCGRNAAKHPYGKLVSNCLLGATCELGVIKHWFGYQAPDANLGVRTDKLIVVDVDPRHGGDETFDALIREHGEPPLTWRVLTGGGGLHVIFACPDGVEVASFTAENMDKPPLGPGIDVRARGGYIVAPSSRHINGQHYEWSVDHHPKDVPLALPPAWVLERLTASKAPSSAPDAGATEPLPSDVWAKPTWQPVGEYRDSAATQIAGHLFCHGCDYQLVLGLVHAWNSAWCKPPLGYQELNDIVDRIALNEAAKRKKEARAMKSSAGPSAEQIYSDIRTEERKKRRKAHGGNGLDAGVTLDDFFAYMIEHKYIFAPTGDIWPGSGVNARIAPIQVGVDDKGEPVFISASAWLDRDKPVEQMTWAPGEPGIISGRLISHGGWISREKHTVFNLYRPPLIEPGNAAEADRWLDHVYKVYPLDADHIIKWCAQRVQFPHIKINHALVLGGATGIGKDTSLEPVKRAVGPWNFTEVSPQQMLGRFNGFVKSVILRINEARDLGEVNRYQFYDHMKAYLASPPDVLRVDEKNRHEYPVFNCLGVVLTSNHKADGIYLTADDRRHYVAWSELTKHSFVDDYWTRLWHWYDHGGDRHVAAYLFSPRL
jgi:hypothetical protein